MADEHLSYDKLIEHNPRIAQVMDPKLYEFRKKSHDKTVEVLSELWQRHFKKNLRLFLDKHGLVNNCAGFGTNKAVIGIGAGPSFNKNKDFVKNLCLWNAQFSFERQPFLFMVSNHQFKPCVEDGIVPHFVVLVDASESDAIVKQLCEGVPKRAERTVLLCSLNSNPRLLKKWDQQGKLIQFYLPPGEWNAETFEKATGRKAEGLQLMQGGNVMNVAWMAAVAAFNSTIFMAVGNDLGYKIEENEAKRRENYYADGDYSTNLASKRDEAKRQFRWMGFDITQGIVSDQPVLTFKPYATVDSLFNYKMWLETTVGIQDAAGRSFHYYNCSEQGILGVLAKKYDTPNLDDKNNWTLMDEVFPERWHTTTLESAVSSYLSARQLWQETRTGIPTSVRSVVV